MIKQAFSLGFDLATLPARMALRGTREFFLLPGNIGQIMAEVRELSDEVARELQMLVESVDREMDAKAAHLSPEQKQQAAELALHSAEQHMSMAARNMLRALWLATSSRRSLSEQRGGETIEQEG
jgi:hypothetical protein